VNARNRFPYEILRCENHQIRLASIEIVSIGHNIAFVFAGAERRGSKHGFARCAVLETVFLDRAAFNVMFEQDRSAAAKQKPRPRKQVVATFPSQRALMLLLSIRH
jgi:hypothetical protein